MARRITRGTAFKAVAAVSVSVSFASADDLLLAVIEFDGLPTGVRQLDLATGAVLTDFVAPDFPNNGMLSSVEAIAPGAGRTVLLGQPGGDGAISRYDENGVFLGHYLGATPDPNPVDNIRGMAVSSDGFLYTSDWDDTDDVHRFVLSTGASAGMVGDPLGKLILGSQAAPGLGRPEAIEILADGDLLVGDIVRQRLVRYDAQTGARIGDFTAIAMIGSITDIDQQPDGTVVTSEDGSGDRIRVFASDGTLLSQFAFRDPDGVHRLASGEFLVTSHSTFAQGKGLFRVSAAGVILQTIDDTRSYGAIELISLIEGGCNEADLSEPFGTLDFGDVLAFLGAFGAMEPAADLTDPVGVFDFNDVLAFLGAFGAGCP